MISSDVEFETEDRHRQGHHHVIFSATVVEQIRDDKSRLEMAHTRNDSRRYV